MAAPSSRRAPRREGHLQVTGPGVRVECATLTCGHCNTVILLHDPQTGARKPPDQVGGWCTLCSSGVCPRCVGKGCTPFEKRMEEVESGRRLLEALAR